MKARVIVGASGAYAAIDFPGANMDIRLSPGRSAARSLRETAAERRQKAADFERRANIADAAAIELERAK